jgi:hypothetical protein
MVEILYFSVSKIAERWDCSADKASRVFEKLRGPSRSGFLDRLRGRKRNRKYSIIRIHPTL